MTTNYANITPLLPNHMQDLQKSGLSVETIKRWGCYSIFDNQPWVMHKLGFGHVLPPAMALPVLSPDLTEPILDRVIIKPDRPRKSPEGRVIKYETKPRSSNRLHAPLGCRSGLGDRSLPLIFTEGQKKAEKAAQDGLVAVAIPGIWNWLSRVSSDVSFPIADFDLIELRRDIYIVPDSDGATNPSVKLASRRLGEFLTKRGANVWIVQLPDDGKGPKVGLDDFLCRHSRRELLELPRESIETEPDHDNLVSELSKESDSAQIEHVLKRISKLESRVNAEQLISKVHKQTGLRVGMLRETVACFKAHTDKKEASPVVEVSGKDREEALELLRRTDLVVQFLKDQEYLGCVGQTNEKIALKLAATSGRRSENPINITIKGESSAGKNYLLQSILETEPTEDVVMLTGMTPKALQYANVTLRHKLIAIAEAPGAQDADYSIRTFQSEKVITIWTVEKDDAGRMVTREHKVEGPAAFFLTTTKAHLHPENETRHFDLFVDESENQTERIFETQNRLYIKPMEQEQRDRVLNQWQNAARLLSPHRVLISFADQISFPTKPLRVRRDRPRFLGLIEASALLHQHAREQVVVKGQHYLVASLDDYAIARKLALGLLKSALSGTTPKCRTLVAWARALDGPFSKQDVDRAMNWSRKTTLKYIREAVDLGSVGMNKETVSRSSEFRFLKDPEDPLLELPRPDEINPDWTPRFQDWT